MSLNRHWARWCLLVLWAVCGAVQAADRPDETLELELSGGNKIKVDRFGHGLQRILWIPTQQETNETRFPLARSMAEMGLEVWLPNLKPEHLEIDKTSVQTIGEMIQLSLPDKANGTLYLFTSGASTTVTGLGLQLWQATRGGDKRFGGLVLAYPDLMPSPTQPDQIPNYAALDFRFPVAAYIFQPERSGTQTSLDDLSQTLQKSKGVVFAHTVTGVSAGYLQRASGPEDELMQASIFPAELKEALKQLSTIALPEVAINPPAATQPAPEPARTASPDSPESDAASVTDNPDTAGTAGSDASTATPLETYPGQPMAPDFTLKDINGKKHTLKKYQGKVIVLNFWATWCPPCIKEIPSLGRLQKRFSSKDLVVLSIDVGETKSDVKSFLKKVPADYPVLLDEEGDIVKAWQLHAFPSTFVIDRKGQIRLAFYGALEWDDAAVIRQLEDSMGIRAKK